MPTAPQKPLKFHLQPHFHYFFPKTQSKGLCGDVIYEGEKIIVIVEKLYRIFILISIWLSGVAGQI